MKKRPRTFSSFGAGCSGTVGIAPLLSAAVPLLTSENAVSTAAPTEPVALPLPARSSCATSTLCTAVAYSVSLLAPTTAATTV